MDFSFADILKRRERKNIHIIHKKLLLQEDEEMGLNDITWEKLTVTLTYLEKSKVQ